MGESFGIKLDDAEYVLKGNGELERYCKDNYPSLIRERFQNLN